LIKKLKNAGENSKQVHALKDIITSFNLHKTPKGIDQKIFYKQRFAIARPLSVLTSFDWYVKLGKEQLKQCNLTRK
jgi:hypothetical protein